MRPTTVAATVSLLILTGGPLAAQEVDAKKAVLTQGGSDLWRASKLPGVRIFGPGNQRVGAVSDLLVGRDGKVKYVVVGIGGVLGLGEKKVAIPFDKVTFADRDDAIDPASETVPIPNTADAAGMISGSQSNNLDHAALRHTIGPTYPDHGTIAMTGDQLKAAPAFHAAAARE